MTITALIGTAAIGAWIAARMRTYVPRWHGGQLVLVVGALLAPAFLTHNLLGGDFDVSDPKSAIWVGVFFGL
jgi:hypothetical protein